MTRPVLPIVLLLLLPLVAPAQPVVKATVSPAAEPKPALRYELLPSGRDRVSGNAAHHYLKASVYRPAPDADRAKATDDERRVQKWEEADLDKLPTDEVKKFLERYKFAFRELEYGTRCKRCEWVAAPGSGADAVGEAVGAVQGHREIARFLSLRVRLELAEKRYDDAVATLRAGLQYGKHLAEGPTLIQMLVGVAVTNVFLARTDEFIARPAAPNLYWGLSSLPRPLVDPRPALDGEDALNESFLPGLAELRKGPVSADRAMELVEQAIRAMAASGDSPPLGGFGGFGARLGLVGYAQAVQAEARKELVARGRDKKDVDAMPAVQAAFLHSFDTYRDLADDFHKWFLMPPPDALDGMAQAAARAKRVKADHPKDVLLNTFLLLLPAVEKVHLALLRTDRKVAALRAVEAIRAHADATGRLPSELSDVRRVPVPPDPLTGKPFEYAADGDTFTLTAPPAGTPPHKTLELKYEVKLRR